jgi:hypothetical protein
MKHRPLAKLFVIVFTVLLFLHLPARAEIEVIPWTPAEPAGAAPDVLKVRVTGSAVSRDIFLPLALDEVRKNISLKRGSAFNIGSNVVSPDSVQAGKTVQVLLWAKIYGDGYETVKKNIIVLIENLIPEDFSEPDRIYVSNSPELLTDTGTLLSGAVERRKAIRYLFHHKNGTGGVLNFVFSLSNPGKEPVRLLIIEGGIETGTNEINVGHQCSIKFIKSKREKRGYIFEIPPGGSYVIHRIRLKPQQIISGLGEIHLIGGARAVFDIKGLKSYLHVASEDRNIGEYTSRRGHGAYGRPEIEINDEYVIGGRWKFIGIGQDSLRNLSSGNTELKGNYGVSYKVRVRIVNPAERENKVELQFSPVSGPSQGTMIVDGELYDPGISRPPDTEKIKVFRVGPKQGKWVNIEMIPESGSFYPVRLVFMSRMAQ